jgi:hypothetical protein
MKTKTGISLPLLVFIWCLPACVEEIELVQKDSRIVVEGWIIYEENAFIKLSKTLSKTAPNNFPSITNAEVVISDSAGNSEVLNHQGRGIYQSTNLQGSLDTEYTIDIITGGQRYSGRSVMPAEPLLMDSIKHLFLQNSQGETIASLINIYFADPAGKPTYALIRVKQEDTPLQKDYLYYDGSSDGVYQQIEITLDRILNPGTKLTVEFFQTEAFVFEFFQNLAEREANSLLGGLTVAPPENPPGNMNNGALGYFGAMTLDSKTVFVQ